MSRSGRADVLRRAVARYGKRDPTADDVLMELFPRYSDREHGHQYHRLADIVIERAQRRASAQEPPCKNCGGPKPRVGTTFCGRRCWNEWMKREKHRRKRDVLDRIRRGMTVAEIAQELEITRQRIYDIQKRSA